MKRQKIARNYIKSNDKKIVWQESNPFSIIILLVIFAKARFDKKKIQEFNIRKKNWKGKKLSEGKNEPKLILTPL